MPEYFDSTVAVSAIFPGSTNYADASARLKAAGDGAYIINHGGGGFSHSDGAIETSMPIRLVAK